MQQNTCNLKTLWLGLLDWWAEKRREPVSTAIAQSAESSHRWLQVGAVCLIFLIGLVWGTVVLGEAVKEGTVHLSARDLRQGGEGVAWLVLATMLFSAGFQTHRGLQHLCQRGQRVLAAQSAIRNTINEKDLRP